MSARAWTGIISCWAYSWVAAQEWQSFLTIHDPLPIVSSSFGEEVRLHGDTLVVNAPGGTGAVYLFARNMGGADQWELCQAILPDTDQTYGNPIGGGFGNNLAFNGTDLLIGSENGAWQYRRNSNGQFVRATTVESGPATPPIGSLAIQDRLLFGVGGSFLNGPLGTAAVYRRSADSDTVWSFVDAVSFNAMLVESCFGSQVFIHNNKVVITDPCYANLFWQTFEGRVLVYEWDDQQDSLIQVLARTEDSSYGLSTSIAFDGDTLLVGCRTIGDAPGVFAYTPDPEVGYVRTRIYSGHLGFSGSQEILLNVWYSLLVDGRTIITGTSTGLAFMEKDTMAFANWTLIRSDTLPGPVERLERSGEWLAAGIRSARMVQLYRNLSVGFPEVRGPASLQTYPIPGEDLVNVVLPSFFAEKGMIQLWDMTGRLLHTIQVNGNSGTVQFHRTPGWTGMQIVRLVDMNGLTLSHTKIIWR